MLLNRLGSHAHREYKTRRMKKASEHIQPNNPKARTVGGG